MRKTTYGPDMSDSDSDSVGFSFSTSKAKTNYHKPALDPLQTLLNQLNDRIVERDFAGYINHFESSEHKKKVDVNQERNNGGWSLFYQACFHGLNELVQYMIREQGAKVNQQKFSKTPLMITCQSEFDSQEVLKTVQILCVKGSAVNVSDSYGVTPFMLACINGHTDVVEFLLKMNVASDALDNNQNNALHFAVENNRPDIVKILLGVQGISLNNVINKDGYTPQQIAESNQYQEIAELFPVVQKEYEVPSSYTFYNCFTDLAPEIFMNSGVPAHFPDIVTMLNGMQCQLLIKNFGKAKISLEEFLLMDDQKLTDIGVIFPFQRKKVLQGLIQFHSQKWSKSSLQLFKMEDQMDYLEFCYVFATLLKHLKILYCSCQYMRNLKSQLTGKPVDRLQNTKRLALCLQQFNEELEKVKALLVRDIKMNPRKDHLLLTQKIKSPKNNNYKNLAITGVALTTVLGAGFCFYTFLKR